VAARSAAPQPSVRATLRFSVSPLLRVERSFRSAAVSVRISRVLESSRHRTTRSSTAPAPATAEHYNAVVSAL